MAALFLLASSFKPDAALSAPPPLAAYGALPQTEDLDLSPNGELFARIATEGETRQLIIEKVSGGVVWRGNMGDLKQAGIVWASDDYLVVYTHETVRLDFNYDDQEFVQAVVVDVKRSTMSPLVSSSNYLGALFGRYGYYQQDGRTYGYFGLIPLEHTRDPSAGGYLTRGYPDLYRVDLETRAAQRVSGGNERLRHWVLDEKGNIVAISDYDNRTGTWKVFGPDSSKAIASGHSTFGFELQGLGRTPGTVIISGHDGPDLYSELSLADGGMTGLATDSPIDHLIFSPTARLLVGAALEGERRRIVMFDPTLARRMQSIAHAFGDASLSLTSISADQSKIVVYVEGGATTGTYQLVDFNTKQATPLADAYSGISDDAVGTVEVVDYRAADGLPIKGILTLPHGSSRRALPLVVMPHGGPESSDSVGFDWEAQAFASRGYAVFQPNFRGSSGHGTAFRDAGFGQWGRKMQTDISDGVADLAARGIVDPRRVCIVGGSYGGYAALAGVTLQHGLYRCAVAYAGVSNPAGMLQFVSHTEGPRYRGSAMRYWRSYFGIGEDDFRVPDEISPLARAGEADAPILLIHGKDDTVVPIEQSERMESALQRAGKPVEFLKLKSEDHWRSRSVTRLQMLEAEMAFVQKHNPAETITAP